MKKKSALLAAAVALAFAGSASAVEFSIDPPTVDLLPGATATGATVQVNSDPAARGANVTFDIPATVTLANVTGNPDVLGDFGTCTYDSVGSVLVVAIVTTSAIDAATACTFDIVLDGAATIGSTHEFVVANTVGNLGCNALAPAPSCTTTVEDSEGNSGGGIGTVAHVTTAVDAPPDVVLSFDPASGGTVTFPGGATQGDTVSEQIDITGGGTNGSGTVNNCAFTGTNAGAFSVTSAQPISVAAGAAGSIDIDCSVSDESQSATLTCDVSDSSGDTQESWTMSCPAGTPIPAPEYSSDPAPGSDITCNGAAGSTVNRTVTISNTGNPTTPAGGVNEQLTYSCSTTGANFSVASGATDTLNVGESTDVVVACTVPLEGEPTATGSLDCTSDDAGQPTASYGLSSSIVTAPPPVPQPSIVPAGSLWSKLLLIGLLAGLGGLIVALRRQ